MRERRVLPLLVLTAVLLALGGWILLNSSLLAVRHVRVEGNGVLSVAEVTTLGGIDLGDNLFRLSPEVVEASLLRSPWIAEADVDRRWPSTVMVAITERSAVGWAVDDGSAFLVAGDGVVLALAPERPGDLPSLGRSSDALAPGSPWGGSSVALRVAASLPPALRRDVAAVSVGERGVVLRLRAGGSAVYGQPTALEAKNAALLSILRRRLEIEYVDLRIASAPAVKPASG